MSSTGIRPRPDPDKRSAENTLLSDQQFVQRMKVFNAESPASGFVGTGTTGGTAPNGGSFLQDATAAVTGAFGLAQQGVDLISETLAISIQDFDEHWTSFAEVANATANDVLDLIDGGDYSGQILKLRIPDGVVDFVIHNANKIGNDTTNILMAGVDDLIVQGGEVIEFIFDTFTIPQAAAQSRLKAGTREGVWRLSGGGNSTPEARFGLFELSADQTTGIVVGGRIEFDIDDTSNGGMTTTAGVISGFLAGRVYQINYGFSAEFSVNTAAVTCHITASGGDLTTTAANSLSVRALIDVSFNPTGTAFYRPAADTDTIQLEFTFVQAVTAILSGITDPNQAGAYLQVVPFQSGGGGGSGGGGTGLTNPLTENLDLDGYNLIMDTDADTFWKNDRDGLADDWTQLIVGGAVGLNVSNRAGNQWIRSGFNLEPNSTQTLGSVDQRWDEVYVDNFMDFDANTPVTPGTGDGRLFWNNTTKSFHQLDDVGTNTDLVGSASDVSQWATFPAVTDVVPNATGRLLGSTTADEQWGGLFMDPSTTIRWETTLGVFTETTLQGTTGGFNLNAPDGGAYSLKIDNTEEFKVDQNSVSINTPTLDFNNAAATIEGLVALNYAFGGEIFNINTIPGLGGAHLVYNIVGTNPGHLFQVDGQELLRIRSAPRALDLRPDNTNNDIPTEIDNARGITFLETGAPSSSSGLANITTDVNGRMLLNAAALQGYSVTYGNTERLQLTQNNVTIVNGLAGEFRINNTVGNSFSFNKTSTLPGQILCDDDIEIKNGSQGLIVDNYGFISASVPAQLFFSGLNSVGARTPYAKIKSRIDVNTSGAHIGDLEFYAYRSGVEEEQITLKGKDPLRSGAVIYMRSNVEFLSQAANADQLILNEALLQMKERGDPGTVFGNDVTVWCDETAGVFSIKARFANGTVKTLADDT